MEIINLVETNGIYKIDKPIVKDSTAWKELLSDESIFNEASLKVLMYWYFMDNCEGTTAEITAKHKLPDKNFNLIIVHLGERICKRLNISIVRLGGKSVYWPICFNGWDKGSNFVWQLKDELKEAIKEMDLFKEILQKEPVETMDDLESNEVATGKEGKLVLKYVAKYERNTDLRKKAKEYHGTICQICGFDFEATYGDFGKDFIQVHHIVPLAESGGEIEVDPKNDLICVCSNCHSMIHHKKSSTLTPDQLRELIVKS